MRFYNELDSPVGKVSEIVNQAGQKTCMSYDLMWNLSSITDPLGNERKYVYDKFSRLVKSTDQGKRQAKADIPKNP